MPSTRGAYGSRFLAGALALGGACGAPPGSNVVSSTHDTLRVRSSTRDAHCVDLDFPRRLDLRARDDDRLRCNGWGEADRCLGNPEYQGFLYEGAGLEFWVNFRPAVVGHYTEAALRDQFRWLWFQAVVPQPGGQPARSQRLFLRTAGEFDAFSFRDGRLRLTARATVTGFVRWVVPAGPGCADTDVGPEVCACRYDVEVPATLDADLALPTRP